MDIHMTMRHSSKAFSPSPVSPWAMLAFRVVLGLVFVVASWSKIWSPEAFAEAIHRYRILPDLLVGPVALALPWLELLLGIFLILGCWLPGAVLLSNLLLAVFTGALVFNWLRGVDVHCGCFDTQARGDPRMLWSLARDSVFLLLAACLFHRHFLKRDAS